jgi:hypothetical protein
VAPLVADHHPRSACLDLDWFFAKLRAGGVAPWRTDAHEQNRTVLAAAAAAVTTFAGGGYATVAEGIIYPFMVDLFDAAARPRGVELHYAVLRAPEAVVQSRVRRRTIEPEHAGALADAAVVTDLWEQFEQHGVEERHRVDAGTLDAPGVADEIDRRWRAGDFRL